MSTFIVIAARTPNGEPEIIHPHLSFACIAIQEARKVVSDSPYRSAWVYKNGREQPVFEVSAPEAK